LVKYTNTVLVLLGTGLIAQAQTEFEVASIRPHVDSPDSRGMVGVKISGPRWTAVNNTLANLVAYAFDLRDQPVTGGPGWASSERFDVAAKAPGDGELTHEKARVMLQTLLTDRFHLKFHRATEEVLQYALVVAKGGPKLKESAADAVYTIRMTMLPDRMLRLTGVSTLMSQLAMQLKGSAGRRVTDRTGLTGTYDFTLDYLPGVDAENSDGPSLFTALQEQLGLKLESIKAPLESIVIDSAEKPSEN
jgi:uncharacterized protein (TIGR03435 family)